MQGNKIHHEGTKDTKILDNSNSELRVFVSFVVRIPGA